MIFTYSEITRTRRYGDFFIRHNWPPKGILLEGSLHIRTEKELSTVVKEFWAAFRDHQDQIGGEEPVPMDEDDKDQEIRELREQLEEAVALLAEFV